LALKKRVQVEVNEEIKELSNKKNVTAGVQ
jgi:hypothetical protein